jgi:hypothetical protein
MAGRLLGNAKSKMNCNGNYLKDIAASRHCKRRITAKAEEGIQILA